MLRPLGRFCPFCPLTRRLHPLVLLYVHKPCPSEMDRTRRMDFLIAAPAVQNIHGCREGASKVVRTLRVRFLRTRSSTDRTKD